ncbi:hypothetical protein BDC45DRAFT_502916 [Circinella umbellata]|nr:hypothetical protein BDC45DRAFT_502916 [Circinella umbellata]
MILINIYSLLFTVIKYRKWINIRDRNRKRGKVFYSWQRSSHKYNKTPRQEDVMTEKT